MCDNFNPHSPHGERRGPPGRTTALRSDFNPHSPHGERRRSGVPAGFYPAFQPTLPARGATRPPRAELPAQVHISTHTPRTGSDCSQSCPWASPCYFNPHSPHGERRCCWAARQRREVFQPTLPARGATCALKEGTHDLQISTHTPRTGSDYGAGSGGAAGTISTHTPRTGSDRCTQQNVSIGKLFQPTLPARGATDGRAAHASVRENFNPHSPHGERPNQDAIPSVTGEFQPTLPARGATPRQRLHCPRRADFNPHSPHGERLLDLKAFRFP